MLVSAVILLEIKWLIWLSAIKSVSSASCQDFYLLISYQRRVFFK